MSRTKKKAVFIQAQLYGNHVKSCFETCCWTWVMLCAEMWRTYGPMCYLACGPTCDTTVCAAHRKPGAYLHVWRTEDMWPHVWPICDCRYMWPTCKQTSLSTWPVALVIPVIIRVTDVWPEVRLNIYVTRLVDVRATRPVTWPVSLRVTVVRFVTRHVTRLVATHVSPVEWHICCFVYSNFFRYYAMLRPISFLACYIISHQTHLWFKHIA